jgi:hypothetical protein
MKIAYTLNREGSHYGLADDFPLHNLSIGSHVKTVNI